MNHLSEDQLVLLYYGESEDAPAARTHLESCSACRAAYTALEQSMSVVNELPLPDRDESYATRVWRQVEPRLSPKPILAHWWKSLLPGPMWTRAAVAAVLVIAAFLVGRHWPRPEPTPVATVASAPAKERILLVAVGNHLERSQMVLVELAHAEPNGGADISAEQQQARGLLADNRLYRQAAARAGETGTAQVLDELERVLVEIANSPSELSPRDLEAIQQRIQSQGILFKVRVLATQTRRKGKAVPSPVNTTPKGRT